MAELKYFTPVLKWIAIVADEPSDPDADPQTKGINGGCEVTASIAGSDARAIRADDLSPAAALVALAAIDARLDDGILKLNASTVLRLVANCPVLELPDGVTIWYTYRFHHITYNGKSQDLPTITVAAPFIADAHDDDVDGEVVQNLATAEWVNPADAIDGAILLRNVPDEVVRVGDTLVFRRQGVALDDPVDISDFVVLPALLDGGAP